MDFSNINLYKEDELNYLEENINLVLDEAEQAVSNPLQQFHIAKILHRLKPNNPKTGEILGKIVLSSNVDNSRAAIEALHAMAPHAIESMPALTQKLKDYSGSDNEEGLEYLAVTLGAYGELAHETLPCLREFMNSSQCLPDMIAAAIAIICIDESGKDALAKLYDLLRDSNMDDWHEEILCSLTLAGKKASLLEPQIKCFIESPKLDIFYCALKAWCQVNPDNVETAKSIYQCRKSTITPKHWCIRLLDEYFKTV
ncbi:hypothetical protein MNBD_GAMMA12-1998 [hydrothermal vent metagenome]|uniref:Bilin biosynthesis protein CpeY n=1 Tax=hydrothermal vent metagenome TaxID=652676 RepID=A0A3B0YLQ0_9ZZZZ